MKSAIECQNGLFCDTAFELARLDKRLAEIARALPRPDDLNALVREEQPAEGQLFSLIAGFRGVVRNTVFQLLELAQSHRATFSPERQEGVN